MDYYDFCIQTVRQAAERLTTARSESFSVEHKHHNPKDIVTSLDRELGEWINAEILGQYPEHTIWNEETAEVAGNQYAWSVDPIDGSANFSRGIPHFGISLGLVIEGVPQCGAVIDPSTGELFSSGPEQGTLLNNAPIGVSPITELKQATVLFAGGRQEGLAEWAGQSYTKLLQNTNKTKNLGSSALDICYVASGRAEAYIAGTLTTRDIAAALCILEDVGGVALNETGEALELSTEPQKAFIARDQAMAEALIDLLAR